MNRVILTGRITRDPEIKYTTSGISTVSFSLAVDKLTRDAAGNRQADFINCVAWRNQADFLANYVRKGYMLCVEGRIQTRSYQAQDGQMRYVTEVVCDQVENLTPRNQNEMPHNNVQPRQPQYQQPSYSQPNYNQNDNTFNMPVEDDDLPF